MAKSTPTPDDEIFELTDIVSKGEPSAPKKASKSEADMLEESLSDLFSTSPQDGDGDATADLDLNALLAEIENPNTSVAAPVGLDPTLDDIFNEIMAPESAAPAAASKPQPVSDAAFDEISLGDIDALLASIEPPDQPEQTYQPQTAYAESPSAQLDKPESAEISLDEIDSLMDNVLPVEKVEGFFAPDKALQEKKLGPEADLEDLDDILNSILDPSSAPATPVTPVAAAQPEPEPESLIPQLDPDAEPETEPDADDLLADLDDLFASLDMDGTQEQALSGASPAPQPVFEPVSEPVSEADTTEDIPAFLDHTLPTTQAHEPEMETLSSLPAETEEDDILMFGEAVPPAAQTAPQDIAFMQEQNTQKNEPDEKVMELLTELAELSDTLTHSLSLLEGRVSTLESEWAEPSLDSAEKPTPRAFEEEALALLEQGHAFHDSLLTLLQPVVETATASRLASWENTLQPAPTVDLTPLETRVATLETTLAAQPQHTNEIANLEDRVSTLEMALAEAEKEFLANDEPADSALEAEKGPSAEVLLEGLQERLAALEARMEETQNNLSAPEPAPLAALQPSPEHLAEMETLEARLAAMEKQLEDVAEKNSQDNKAILENIEKAAAEAAARVIREEILAVMAEEM